MMKPGEVSCNVTPIGAGAQSEECLLVWHAFNLFYSAF